MNDLRSVGPRSCHLVDANGRKEAIEISITYFETYGEPAHGDAMAFTGRVRMKSDERDSEFVIYASDEILLIGRAVFIVGSQLLGECERGGLTLNSDCRDDIRDWSGLF